MQNRRWSLLQGRQPLARVIDSIIVCRLNYEGIRQAHYPADLPLNAILFPFSKRFISPLFHFVLLCLVIIEGGPVPAIVHCR